MSRLQTMDAAGSGFELFVIDTPSLGDRSYLATDGEVGLVIDPQRDVERVLALAEDRGLRLTHVAETHIHNDYVSGGLALARATGATYVVAAADPVAFERRGVEPGDRFHAGRMEVRVLAAPGHTPTHLAYSVALDERPVALFTGGSMLYGAVGRTDLIDPAQTEALTRQQYRTVRRLAEGHPDPTPVYPTHGFGSFCSATPVARVALSDVGTERRRNPALTVDDEERFVKETLEGLTPYPRYYARMGYLNLAGAFPPDLSPLPPLGASEVLRRVRAGEWVVDLRPRERYAAAHLRGTVNVEVRSPDFAPYLGWIAPGGVRLTLIGETPDEIARAQPELARIGIDRPAGAFIWDPRELPAEEVASYEVADFARLKGRGGEVTVLDVRHPHEWEAGHIEGAVHVPFEELPARVADVPTGEVWVHCRTGMRASVAASLLDDGKRRVVLVDDRFERAPRD